jgi:starch synthase
VLPRYRQIDIGKNDLRPVVTGLQVPLGAQKLEATIYEGRLGDMVVYFVDCPALFDRDGIVGFGDDDARSVFFSRALLEMLPALEFFPDVIHIHDWFAALVPNLLERVYSEGAYAKIATNLTIHNLAAQGTFGFGALVLASLEVGSDPGRDSRARQRGQLPRPRHPFRGRRQHRQRALRV